jgi:hypothetical protein
MNVLGIFGFLQDSVGVEFGTTSHVGNVRARSGAHNNPTKSGNTLSNSGKVVEELACSDNKKRSIKCHNTIDVYV